MQDLSSLTRNWTWAIGKAQPLARPKFSGLPENSLLFRFPNGMFWWSNVLILIKAHVFDYAFFSFKVISLLFSVSIEVKWSCSVMSTLFDPTDCSLPGSWSMGFSRQEYWSGFPLIPGTAGPGGLPSLGSHRVGHDWNDLTAAAAAALSFSRGSSWPRDRSQVSGIVGRCFTVWATRKAVINL